MRLGSIKITRCRFIIFGCLFFAIEAKINFSEYFVEYDDITCEQGYYDSGREPGEPFRRGRASGKRFYLVDSEKYIVGRYMHHPDNYPLTIYSYHPGRYHKVWADDRTIRTVCYARPRSVIPFVYENVILTYSDAVIERESFLVNFEGHLSSLKRSGIMHIAYNFLIVFMGSLAIRRQELPFVQRG